VVRLGEPRLVLGRRYVAAAGYPRYRIAYCGAELLEAFLDEARDHAGGFFDVDGAWISESEIFIHDHLRHHGTSRRERPAGHDDAERTGDVRHYELNAEKWPALDYLRSLGWQPMQAGSSGLPRGRPVKGMTRPELIIEEIEKRCNEYSIQQFRACVRRGRPPQRSLHARDQLAVIVCELVTRSQRPVNCDALARVLQCDTATITRLNHRGKELLQQKSPNRGESVFLRPREWADRFLRPGSTLNPNLYQPSILVSTSSSLYVSPTHRLFMPIGTHDEKEVTV
jgi:hypothetical protein